MMTPRAASALMVALLAIGSALHPEVGAAPAAFASARQFLPPLPGYIPVYIRRGDEPLENVNVDLAAAFRAYAGKHGVHTGRAHPNELRAPLGSPHAEEKASYIQKIAPPAKAAASK